MGFMVEFSIVLGQYSILSLNKYQEDTITKYYNSS